MDEGNLRRSLEDANRKWIQGSYAGKFAIQNKAQIHCYPIEPKALHKILLQPRNGPDECDKARITADCARPELDISHNQVRQKSSPYLPLNRVLVLSEEVLKLQSLLKFLEEQFNLPACFVEFCNRRRGPFEVVGKENEVMPIAVYLDKCRDAPQDIGIGLFCLDSRKASEELLHHDRISRAVGIRESVEVCMGDAADA